MYEKIITKIKAAYINKDYIKQIKYFSKLGDWYVVNRDFITAEIIYNLALSTYYKHKENIISHLQEEKYLSIIENESLKILNPSYINSFMSDSCIRRAQDKTKVIYKDKDIEKNLINKMKSTGNCSPRSH